MYWHRLHVVFSFFFLMKKCLMSWAMFVVLLEVAAVAAIELVDCSGGDTCLGVGSAFAQVWAQARGHLCAG